MEKAIKITDANFESVVLNTDKPVLVDFWATWCGPCITMGPIIEELAKKYEGKVVIGKLDVDQNTRASAKYGIRSIPTILIFDKGKEVHRQVGACTKQDLSTKIEGLIGSPV